MNSVPACQPASVCTWHLGPWTLNVGLCTLRVGPQPGRADSKLSKPDPKDDPKDGIISCFGTNVPYYTRGAADSRCHSQKRSVSNRGSPPACLGGEGIGAAAGNGNSRDASWNADSQVLSTKVSPYAHSPKTINLVPGSRLSSVVHGLFLNFEINDRPSVFGHPSSVSSSNSQCLTPK